MTTIPPKSASPTEHRDLLASLLKGAYNDLRAACPDPFGSLPENPTAHDALVSQGATVLIELVVAASYIATGLREDDERSSSLWLNSGLRRVTHSRMLRHLFECPGHRIPPLPTGHPEPSWDDLARWEDEGGPL